MTSDLWKRYEGAIVGGRYPLLKCLGNTDRAATFLGESGEGGRRIVVKLIEAVDARAEASLFNWAEISKLSHPHLVPLLDWGRCEIDGAPFVYAVMEWAEENLGGVLATRPLEEIEVREMLEPVLQALGFLHSKGFVHAGLKPSNVMAAGDRLQLASDSITAAGQIDKSSDVYALGVTVVESFTRRPPDGDAESMAGQLPGPFDDIVRHSLLPDPQARWTVERIASRLRGEIPKPIPTAKHGSKWLYPKWLYPALAAALGAIALFAFLGRKHDDTRRPAPPATAQPAPLATAQPAPPPQATAPKPPPPALKPPRPTGARVWYVVAATYVRRSDAEKRARHISIKWPKFQAKVYAPPSGSEQYLVVLGANLSQNAAAGIRQRAVAAGLPRDTYIKKYPPS